MLEGHLRFRAHANFRRRLRPGLPSIRAQAVVCEASSPQTEHRQMSFAPIPMSASPDMAWGVEGDVLLAVLGHAEPASASLLVQHALQPPQPAALGVVFAEHLDDAPAMHASPASAPVPHGPPRDESSLAHQHQPDAAQQQQPSPCGPTAQQPEAQTGPAVTAAAINSLARVLDALASSPNPRLRCVPLLPAAGWTLVHVAAYPRTCELLLVPCDHSPLASSSPPDADGNGVGSSSPHHLAAASTATTAAASTSGVAVPALQVAVALDALRPPSLPPLRRRQVTPAPAGQPQHAQPHHLNPQPQHDGRTPQLSVAASPQASASTPDGSAQPAAAPPVSPMACMRPSYHTQVDGRPAPPGLPLSFRRVAVGGTFDRLHAGHELLLAATALVAQQGGYVFVGVTADALLASKSHRALLQPYDVRAATAVSYLQAVRPNLRVEVGPLSDPKAPTAAELDPSMEALVVSVETMPGAAAINAGRAARGFAPLVIVTVPVIGMRPVAAATAAAAGGPAAATAAAACEKLSSSGLRAEEAAAAAAAGRK